MERLQSDVLIRKLSDYEKISGILWLALSIVQIISIFGIIAGVWNFFAALSRLGMSKKILSQDEDVPSHYEGISQLIIIGLINLFFGAAIGIIFVVFDFFIREKILENRSLFSASDVVRQRGAGLTAYNASPRVVDSSTINRLERLAGLKEKGIISEEEFLLEKRKIF